MADQLDLFEVPLPHRVVCVQVAGRIRVQPVNPCPCGTDHPPLYCSFDTEVRDPPGTLFAVEKLQRITPKRNGRKGRSYYVVGVYRRMEAPAPVPRMLQADT